MSWLTKTLSILAGESSESDDDVTNPSDDVTNPSDDVSTTSDDIADLTKTLSRQFWSAAAFFAPLPSNYGDLDGTEEDSPEIAGIRSDLAEFGGKLRSGVSEMSKFASSIFDFDQAEEEGDDEDDDVVEGIVEEEGFEVNAVGVSEEILMFVQSIAMYRGTWLDFPLIDYLDDFEMSNTQNEHALAVEHLVPTLANLRNELCPSQMSECCFWKIYFVLLHPKLSMHEADLLSTSQVLNARAMLLLEATFGTPEPEASILGHEALDLPIEGNLGVPLNLLVHVQSTKTVACDGSSFDPILESDIEKRPVQPLETEVIDKSVIQEQPYTFAKSKDLYCETSKSSQHYEADDDDWLENDAIEAARTRSTTITIGPEDASFSGLEEKETSRNSSTKINDAHRTESDLDDSKDWVQLNKDVDVLDKVYDSVRLQRKDSNDWLNIEDIDVE